MHQTRHRHPRCTRRVGVDSLGTGFKLVVAGIRLVYQAHERLQDSATAGLLTQVKVTQGTSASISIKTMNLPDYFVADAP